MLQVLHELPPGLLECTAGDVVKLLPGPSLIHLPGRQEQPLFVSVLLHGDEDTGLRAMQELLIHYRERELPRALSLFIGNVTAAQAGQRRLESQPDFNRVWPGGSAGACPESQMAQRVVDEMRTRKVFASVDIHNNTGINPHYGCINRLEPEFLHLAAWFSRTVVYFTHPRGTQTAAFAELCPAVTLECGKPGTQHGVEHARDFVDGCLHLAQFPEDAVHHEDVDLYETLAVVKVPAEISFNFIDQEADIRFDPALDHLNFRELRAETPFAELRCKHGLPLQAWDREGRDIAEHLFVNMGGRLCTRVPFMPAMLTLKEQAIRQDCLCYAMHRLALPARD
jgi:succinylglutamate desuccinylase